MTHQDSDTTRLRDYIAKVLPWAHGHQLNGIATFVGALIDKQTGNQAELAREDNSVREKTVRTCRELLKVAEAL